MIGPIVTGVQATGFLGTGIGSQITGSPVTNSGVQVHRAQVPLLQGHSLQRRIPHRYGRFLQGRGSLNGFMTP